MIKIKKSTKLLEKDSDINKGFDNKPRKAYYYKVSPTLQLCYTFGKIIDRPKLS